MVCCAKRGTYWVLIMEIILWLYEVNRGTTYIEETAQIFDKISISAGQRGVQVILNPEELAKYVDAQFVALI